MSTKEDSISDKAFYRINDPDRGEDDEISTGSKRSKKKCIIIVT